MISVGDWLRTRVRVGQIVVVTMLGMGGLAGGLIFLVSQLGIWSMPQAVVQRYLTSVYARDYDFISATDKAVKSREEYLRENRPFTGFTLEATRQLASFIKYLEIQTEQQGNRATVTVKFVVPDGNAEGVQVILFPTSGTLASRDRELSETECRALLMKLDQLHESGQTPRSRESRPLNWCRSKASGGSWRIGPVRYGCISVPA